MDIRNKWVRFDNQLDLEVFTTFCEEQKLSSLNLEEPREYISRQLRSWRRGLSGDFKEYPVGVFVACGGEFYRVLESSGKLSCLSGTFSVDCEFTLGDVFL